MINHADDPNAAKLVFEQGPNASFVFATRDIPACASVFRSLLRFSRADFRTAVTR